MNSNSTNLYSERLCLRPLTLLDQHWILSLQQDALWLKYIGSKGVNTLQDACDYIENTNAQRQEWGYGLWAVEDKHTAQPLGVCGLFNRFAFQCPDLGFAIGAGGARSGVPGSRGEWAERPPTEGRGVWGAEAARGEIL